MATNPNRIKVKWMQGAVKHPGALRATAKAKGLIKGTGKLTSKVLGSLAKTAKRTGNSTLAKRVTLARTFKRFHK